MSIKIFNLSKKVLNPYEISLLKKCLSFCPSHDTDPFELFIDLYRFTRKLTLKRHFEIQQRKNESAPRATPSSNQVEPMEGKHKDIKTKSSYYPIESQGNWIQTLHDLVSESFQNIPNKGKKDSKRKRKNPPQEISP